MAKTFAPLFSLAAHGTLASLLTYSKRNSGQQVRYQKKQKDVLSAARTKNRLYFSMGLSWWALLSTEDKMLFDNYDERAE